VAKTQRAIAKDDLLASRQPGSPRTAGGGSHGDIWSYIVCEPESKVEITGKSEHIMSDTVSVLEARSHIEPCPVCGGGEFRPLCLPANPIGGRFLDRTCIGLEFAGEREVSIL
jgi:hypothetical protein